MPAPDKAAKLPADVVRTFAVACTQTQRKELLYEEPLLRSPSAVEAVCAQAHQWEHTDLPAAHQAAQNALWLAATLQDTSAQALAHRTNANILEALSRSSEAFAEYQQAIELFRLVNDSHQIAITRSSAIASITNTLGPDHAFEWAEQARKVFEASADHLRIARLHNNLATVFFRQEDFRQALAYWQLAHSTLEQLGEVSDQAVTLTNLATCFISLNQPAEAQHYYQTAHELCQQNNLTRLLHLVEYNIAYLYFLQGNHDRALHLYKVARESSHANGDLYFEALCNLDESEIYIELNLLAEASAVSKLAEEQFGRLAKSYERAKAQFNRALVSFRHREPHLALDLLAQAGQIFRQEGNRLWPGKVDYLIALTLAEEGRHFEAKRAAEASRHSFHSSGLARHRAFAELLLARITLALHSPQQAEDFCKRALGTLLTLREPDSLFQAYFVLAEVCHSRGDPEAAIAALRNAERRLREVRERLVTPPSQTPLILDPLQVYADLVTLLLNHPSEALHGLEVFALVERSKVRGLADLRALRASQLRPRAHVRSQLVDQVSLLRSELNWLYRRIDVAGFQDKATKSSFLEKLQLKGQEKELQLAQTLVRFEPERASTPTTSPDFQVGNVRELQTRAGQSVVLEYFIANDLIVAVILSAGELSVVPVAVESTVRELLRRLWFYSEHPHRKSLNLDAAPDRSARRILNALYCELLEPFEGLLHGQALIIVPHGFLHYLPFHAFRRDERFLFETTSIAYLPSATSLLDVTQPRAAEVLPRGFAECRDRRRERSVFPVLAEAHIVSSSQVTDALDRRTRDQDWIALHLVAEAVFRHDSPIFSTLQIGSDEVSLFELYRQRLPCSVLTLEGVELHAGQAAEGDEVAALWRALLASGVTAALVPVWPAPPSAHRRLAQLFYAELFQGQPAGSAFARAMTEAKREAAAFLGWACCALVGDPRFQLPHLQPSAGPDHT